MAIAQKSQTGSSGAQKAEVRNISSAKPGVGPIAPDKIAARAYEIWQASGRSHGHDQEHWFQAERELRGTQGSRATSR
jgi:Protein of unknown function (DUF2934)